MVPLLNPKSPGSLFRPSVSPFSIAYSSSFGNQKDFSLSPSTYRPVRNQVAIKMSSDSVPSLPEHRIVVGCGSAAVDFLAAVASYPKPDDKVRSTSLKVQGGGNAANALTCAARLGLRPRLISKVADDAQGRSILEELEADGVDTSFFVESLAFNK